MLRWRAVSGKVARYGAEQWTVTDRLQRTDERQRASIAGFEKEVEQYNEWGDKRPRERKAGSRVLNNGESIKDGFAVAQCIQRVFGHRMCD